MSTYYDPYAPARRPTPSYVWIWPLILLAAVVLLLAWRFWPHGEPALNPSAKLRTVAVAEKLSAIEESQIALYKSASPSVVNVTNLAVLRDRFSFNLQRIPRGIGSGFIWDEEGHVVTNHHVVEGGDAITVTLADHSTYKVERIASDKAMDLAVLWIRAPKSKLRPLPLGESRTLQVGQFAFAIGNPFGLDQSWAPGSVSALNREIRTEDGDIPIKGVIQTTAPINPGNSGGPLLDSSGRLIGVNSAIATKSGSWAGIGFAIPADDVNRVVTQLIAKGKVSRPGLGIEPAPDKITRRLGISTGVLILNVTPDGPADAAGLQPTRRSARGIIPGDVILKIGDTPVRTTSDLQAALQRYAIGDEVVVTYQRDDETGQARVVLGEESR
jgi:S1-C subfamily serine protease